MPSSILKRTRSDEREPRRPKKKIRKSKKQLEYHSSSDEAEDDDPKDFKAINLQDSDDEDLLAINTAKNTFIGADSDNEDVESDVEKEVAAEDSDATGASSDSDASGTASINGTKKRKRNDPEVFATSMSKILGTKLTTTKRSDPVLSRSAAATSISKEVSESRLEARARQKLRLERKHALDKGRVKDVLGLGDEEQSTQGIMESEKRLKKTAQRGVIKLFNAVREAQKRGEDAKREALKEGVVGMDRREEKVSEMSKKGFMELIASGGK
jgi:Rrp15p